MSMAEDGKIIEWRDGYPYAKYVTPYTREEYHKLYPAAAAVMYKPKKWRLADSRAECGKESCTGCYLELGDMMPGEDDFIGKTRAAVAKERLALAASYGDFDADEKMNDRIIGKPKQEVSNVNVTVDLTSVLDRIMAADQQKLLIEDNTPKEIDYLDGL